MDTGSLGQSNTLALLVAVLETTGDTFTEKSENYLKVLQAKMSRVGQGSDKWQHHLREKGQVQGFIRHDKYGLKLCESQMALAA